MKILNFIKSYYQVIIIIAIIIIGILIYNYINNLITQNKQLKEESNVLRLEKQGTSTKILIRYVDSSNENHTVINKDANTIPEASVDSSKIGLLDSTSRELNIAKDKINQITKVNYTLSINNINLTRRTDSLTKKISYVYNGKYLHYYEVGDSIRTGNYTYNGDIQYVDYSKKKIPLIGRTFNYTDIFSSDSSFRVGNVSRLTIEHLPKTWSVKLKAGFLYNTEESTGIKLEIGFKSFSFIGGRYYNYKGASNLIGIDYTLLSF